MKLRSIALVGAAVLALSVPASASGTAGWYVGLGAGWDSMTNFNQVFTPGPVTFKAKTEDTGLFVGSFGYRFGNGFRLEDE
ncbi:MAG: hypothetical protein KJS68_11400, partial [Alphaproteobacteria bacterium]|nr:hypothetical protein [Alphaproteobacteria bacterium]